MLKKILLGFRIVLPFIVNVLLFNLFYDLNGDSQYILTDTLFALGIVNLVYGLGTMFFVQRNGGTYINTTKAAAVNLGLADQYIKNYHSGKANNTRQISMTANYLKLIYIIIGILLIIASIVSYSI